LHRDFEMIGFMAPGYAAGRGGYDAAPGLTNRDESPVMAEDPSNTKPDLCSLDEADWVSATELGESITQINHGAWILAPAVIREALLGGCGAVLELKQNGQKNYGVPPPGFWLPPDRLRWVNRLNPSMRREEYHDRPWPWELRAYLPPSEPWEFRRVEGFPLAREQVSTLRVFLRRVEAVQWGLLPALESSQAVASEKPPSPGEQPGEPTVGSTSGETAPAPASVADASAPAANTEVPVAKPEVASPPLVDAMTAKTATPPPEPATLIDAANDKPPEPNSDRQSEQSGNPVWDWSTLVQHLQAKKLTFNTEQDALEHYRSNVQRIDEMKAGDGPDETSVRRANKKYKLHKYVTIKKRPR
jgi:hypothetical protein